MIINKKMESYGHRCVNCGYCVSFCPVGAITKSENGIIHFNQKKCKAPVCQNCISRCVINALALSFKDQGLTND